MSTACGENIDVLENADHAGEEWVGLFVARIIKVSVVVQIAIEPGTHPQCVAVGGIRDGLTDGATRMARRSTVRVVRPVGGDKESTARYVRGALTCGPQG